MIRNILAAAIIIGSAGTSLYAEQGIAEIRLRDLELDGFTISTGQLTLTATFDVKRERVLDEVVFDYYLLLNPEDEDLPPQFLHCRTVHRYLEKKSSLTSGVSLGGAGLEGINPRSNAKYAVVVTYQGEEVGVENSEDDRWWEDSSLGSPVENILNRFADVPIVREWESGR